MQSSEIQRFIKRTIIFLFPIIILIIWTLLNYKADKGDLRRMSYLQMNYNYETIFYKYEHIEHRISLLNLDSAKSKKWNFFTIGDSFFQQRKYGFVNFLAHKYPDEVLDFSRKYLVGDNPLLTLQGLVNSDFFDSVDVKYVLFESVERYIVNRSLEHNSKHHLYFQDIENNINALENRVKKKEKRTYSIETFGNFFLNNIAYNFFPSGQNRNVYLEPITEKLFSTKKNNVLFYREDVDNMEQKNKKENIEEVIKVLNEINQELAKRGIHFFVLIFPDKFDIYNEFMVNKDDYPTPVFFNTYNNLSKEFENFDIYTIFQNLIRQGKKDIYLYEDTHISPIASEILVKEFKKRIEQ